MADPVITEAPEVEQVAQAIITKEHEFARLRTRHIVYIFRDIAQKKSGKTVYGTAEVVRGKNAHLYWNARSKKESPTPTSKTRLWIKYARLFKQ
jgi:hypothetical protein